MGSGPPGPREAGLDPRVWGGGVGLGPRVWGGSVGLGPRVWGGGVGSGPLGLREAGLGPQVWGGGVGSEAGGPGPHGSRARGLSAAPCRTVWRRHRVLLLAAAFPAAA